MKKLNVLLVAPIRKFGNVSVSNGYENASFGYYYVLKKLERMSIINKVTVMSTVEPVLEYPSELYDIGLLICHPDSLSKTEDPKVQWLFKVLSVCKRRMLSIVWETDPLPDRWNFLWDNEFFTEFTSPSYFILDQIKKNTNKPVYYLPHFINVNKYSAININKKTDEEKFTVTWIGQYTERKSLSETVIAFSRVFQECDNVQLIIKYSLMAKFDKNIEDEIKRFIALNSFVNEFKPEVFIMNEKIPSKGMIDLYQKSSLFCMPSKGEGFGLPLAEASSIGIPCIYVDWSACSEVMKGLNGCYSVKYNLDTSFNMFAYGYEIESSFACPRIESLQKQFNDAYKLWNEDKEKYYRNVSNNRNLIDKKYGFNSIKNCFENLFQGVHS